MTLPLSVRDAEGQEYWGPYILYLSDWTEERYLRRSPRDVDYRVRGRRDDRALASGPLGINRSQPSS